MKFANVIGQDAVKAQLIKTVHEGRVSHAQLFFGPEGSGKLALALAYAQFINCRNRGETDSCGVCSSCLKYEKLIHPDLHFFFPVTTTKEVKKDPVSAAFLPPWREVVVETSGYFGLNQWYDRIGVENKQGIINAEDCNQMVRALSLKAFEAFFKVIIIWMAEKIYYSAAPKILKILEEPPEQTLFILIAESQEKIISTILSRTQFVKIPRPKDIDVLDYLVHHKGMDNVAAKNLVTSCDGNLSVIFSSPAIDEAPESGMQKFRDWMLMLHSNKMEEIHRFVNEMAKTGREKQKYFLAVSLQWIRRSFLASYQATSLRGCTVEEQEFALRFGKFLQPDVLDPLYQEFNQAIFHIERNGNPTLIFLDLSLKTRRLLFGVRNK